MDELSKENQEKIEAILYRGSSEGLAFVDYESDDCDADFSMPEIDVESAREWLRGELVELLK